MEEKKRKVVEMITLLSVMTKMKRDTLARHCS